MKRSTVLMLGLLNIAVVCGIQYMDYKMGPKSLKSNVTLTIKEIG